MIESIDNIILLYCKLKWQFSSPSPISNSVSASNSIGNPGMRTGSFRRDALYANKN